MVAADSTEIPMNARLRMLGLSAVLAMAFGSVFAEVKPALVVQVVSTEDTPAYVAMITKANAMIKAKTGLEKLRHVWIGDQAGDAANGIFVVSQFPSAAAAAQMQEKFADDPEIKAFLAELKNMRHLGPCYLYKAIRLEGVYEGGGVFVTNIACTDEDGYAKALDGLKAVFDANGFKDARVNLWRMTAGRSTWTHIVVISFPSQTRVAELLDAIGDQGLLKEWNVGAAKLRTTVTNGTYHEITK